MIEIWYDGVEPSGCRAGGAHLSVYQQALEDTGISAFFILRAPVRGAGKRGRETMAWLYLCIAGVMEVVWSTCMKFSHGFTDLKFSILTVAGMIVSFVFLAQATKALPLGTSYAVWTGIGALGALIAGVLLFREPATPARMFFAALLLVGILGLKATSGH